MNHPIPRQWEPLAAIPILAGLYWLLGAEAGGWLFWGLLPGALMLSTGLGLLLWPGDLRLTQFMAGGAVVGLLLLLFVLIWGGLGDAVLAGIAAVASYLVAGRVALVTEPQAEGAPAAEPSWPVAGKAALDEALLAYFIGTARVPSGDSAVAVCDQADRLEEALESGGFLKKPERLHPAPEAPADVTLSRRRIYGREFEHLRFPSDYRPEDSLPGGDTWMQFRRNHTMHAWVMRHPGPERPWLCCVHGYRMGEPWLDFTLFSPGWLHHELGLNLVVPVLPMHGPRRAGLLSGDLYLDGDPLDLVFAQSQALWDLRRVLAWIRAGEPDARIGLLGYSMGGYNTALLAQYDQSLEFAIAGIPVIDYATAVWRHLPRMHRGYFEQHGLDAERYRRMLTPVSPLARKPRLDRDQLHIFAGTADRVVLPEQVLRLAAHWGVEIGWYQGGHLTFRNERVLTDAVRSAVSAAGWSPA